MTNHAMLVDFKYIPSLSYYAALLLLCEEDPDSQRFDPMFISWDADVWFYLSILPI